MWLYWRSCGRFSEQYQSQKVNSSIEQLIKKANLLKLRIYLCLFAGQGENQTLPKGLTEERVPNNHIQNENRRQVICSFVRADI